MPRVPDAASFAHCLPPGTPEYVALWAEALYWRHTEGTLAAARRLNTSPRTIRRRCRQFVQWMRRQGDPGDAKKKITGILSNGGHIRAEAVDKPGGSAV